MFYDKILSNWNIRAERVERVPTGIFNETYAVFTDIGEFILQKLHPLTSGSGPTKNYAAITSFLRSRGFPAQEIIPTASGKLLAARGNESWRLIKPVAGRVYEKAEDAVMAGEAGKMLGRVHLALGKFNKPLAKTLPMFRYDDVFAKLKGYRKKFRSSKNRRVGEAASFLLENFPKRFLPAGLPKRIIHTDPKISNFVFDDGAAISMIDWDTAQKLSPLYDLGDALRSICGGEEDDERNKFDAKKYKKFLKGYLGASGGYLNAKEKALINRAAGLVMLGLAARFLNDCVDDFYFGWDKKRYGSRREHNLARALGQVALYKDLWAVVIHMRPLSFRVK